MQVKRYDFKGLDLRTKDLLKNPMASSDVLNVLLDSQRNIIKRFGYDLYNSLANCIQLIPYKEDETFLAITSGSDALYKLDTSTDSWEKVNFMGSGTAPTYSEPVSYVEYNGVLYFTDPAGVNEKMKFDGYRWYRAGLPTPEVSLVSGGGGGTIYARFFYSFWDLQGNKTYSDILEYTGNDGDTVKNETANYPDGYYYKFADIIGGETADNSDPTIDVNSHNYVANDFVRSLVSNSNRGIVPIRIESVTSTSITIDTDYLESGEFIDDIGLDFTQNITTTISQNSSFGYKYLGKDPIFPHPDMEDPDLEGGLTYSSSLEAAENYYDFSVVKSPPPKCRYIAEYNGVVVLANYIIDTTTFTTKEKGSTSQDTLFWSDLSVGGSPESYPPFNFEVIGNTSEGGITGLFGGEDELTVFKESQVYGLTGILSLRDYRIRNMLTNGNGCVSHQSIIELSGGCLFQSQRGIYAAGGGSRPKEISDVIEPLFTEDTTGLDFTKTVAVNDVKQEKIYFFIPATSSSDSIVLIYDYYYGEWFKFKGIDASGGIIIYDNELYHSDSSDVFKRSSSYNDNGSAIEAYYATSWQDLSAPSLRKKFVNLVAFAISSLTYTLSITSQKDWTDADVFTSTIDFPENDKQSDRKQKATQAFSMRFIFKNDTLNEGMFLSGYDLVVEDDQYLPKGG
jgi:hypothetical protein